MASILKLRDDITLGNWTAISTLPTESGYYRCLTYNVDILYYNIYVLYYDADNNVWYEDYTIPSKKRVFERIPSYWQEESASSW